MCRTRLRIFLNVGLRFLIYLSWVLILRCGRLLLSVMFILISTLRLNVVCSALMILLVNMMIGTPMTLLNTCWMGLSLSKRNTRMFLCLRKLRSCLLNLCWNAGRRLLMLLLMVSFISRRLTSRVRKLVWRRVVRTVFVYNLSASLFCT